MKKKIKTRAPSAPVPAEPAPCVITPVEWAIHAPDQIPVGDGSTFIELLYVDCKRYVQISQCGETISLDEDEFELVVQAGAAAFLQRWPK